MCVGQVVMGTERLEGLVGYIVMVCRIDLSYNYVVSKDIFELYSFM